MRAPVTPIRLAHGGHGAPIRTVTPARLPDYIQAMAKVNGRFVILLDVNQVLAAEELLALAEAGEPGAAGANS